MPVNVVDIEIGAIPEGAERPLQDLVGYFNGYGADNSEYARIQMAPVYNGAADTFIIDGQRTSVGGGTLRLRSLGTNHLTLTAAGATTGIAWTFGLQTTLNGIVVTGAAIFQSTATFNAGTAFNATAAFNASVSIGDTSSDVLIVAATSTFNGPVTANGNVTIGSDTADALVVHAAGAFNATVAFNGSVALGDAAGDAIVVNGTLTAQAPATFNGNVTTNANTTLGSDSADTLTINATTTFATPVGSLSVGTLTVTGSLSSTGSNAFGNADADTQTSIGVWTHRNAANTLTQMLVDAGNNRVVLLSGTPLGSDTTPAVHVVGRAYFAPESANDFAIELRRSNAASVGFRMGLSSGHDLLFKDDSDTQVVLIGDVSATYQLDVTGDAHVSDDVTIDGDLTVGAKLTYTGQAARAYNSTNQLVATVTATALALDSERYDTDAIHDNATNNSRLTCKTAGRYAIAASASFAANATGFRRLGIRLNGITEIARTSAPSVGAADPTDLTVETEYELAVNDYVQMVVYQSSGGNLNVLASTDYSPVLAMARVG